MLIDLSALLLVNGEEKAVVCPVGLDSFDTGYSSYLFIKYSQCILKFTKQKDKKIVLDYTIKAGLIIPCDRCLEDVAVDFDFSDTKEIDMSESPKEQIDAMDEISYIDGNIFDSDKFIHDELIINMPVKILCKDDCKGICKKCGKNLNNGDCHCDTTELDPRMSKVLDVFNQFKEV